jgi:hypothetical protein
MDNTDTTFRRRPGRPPNAAPETQAAAPVEPPVEAMTALEKPAKRRKRGAVGEMAQKLSAPARPGFQRRWFNDHDNRIAKAGELAYEHVTETGIQSSAPGSRVSRLVGTKPNGEPLHSYLMETPLSEYQLGVEDKEEVNRQVDKAIDAACRPEDGSMNEGFYGGVTRERGR